MKKSELIAKRIKNRELGIERENKTFRLRKDLTNEFQHRCEELGVSMTAVLEELIQNFVVS